MDWEESLYSMRQAAARLRPEARPEPHNRRSRREPCAPVVVELEERDAIVERLQAVEDALLVAGKCHAILDGVKGVFEWYAVGAEREPKEKGEGDDVREIEDMIVTHAPNQIQAFETQAGTFIWRSSS